ncbi:MAG: hypothetical protein P8P74_02625 [Crocinitomicaceae bacterium]|nr:hypothetical protein [Crocinitomicaceae bacterium]
MKYTSTISKLLKDHGKLNLGPSAEVTVKNIIWLEGRIFELQSLKPIMDKAGLPHFLDIRIFERNKQLTEITHNLEPLELIEKLSNNSPY